MTLTRRVVLLITSVGEIARRALPEWPFRASLAAAAAAAGRAAAPFRRNGGATIGRVAAIAIGACAMTASAAELSRLVKARMVIAGGVSVFRHDLSVSNKDESRRVVSVLLWQSPGLPELPRKLTAPDGWEVRSLPREWPNGVTWAVQFRCIPSHDAALGSQASGSPATDEEVPCGIRGGQTLHFYVVLPYPADIPASEPILVDFSDGRIGIASR